MDMKELIQLGMQLALIAIVAAVGLQARWRDVVETMRRPAWLLRAIVAVNIIVPATALIVIAAFPMGRSIKIGLVLMAVSPLAPLVASKLMRSGAEASRIVGYYVLLTLLSVVIVPATIALLSQLLPTDATISMAAIAKLVGVSVLAPLAVGLAVGTATPLLAERLAKPLTLIGYGLLFLLSVPIVLAQAKDVAGLVGDGTVLAMALTSLSAVAAGHWLGGPELRGRLTLATAAATRHPGMAVLIINSNFQDQRAVLAVMLYLAVSALVSGSYQAWAKRREPAAAAALA